MARLIRHGNAIEIELREGNRIPVQPGDLVEIEEAAAENGIGILANYFEWDPEAVNVNIRDNPDRRLWIVQFLERPQAVERPVWVNNWVERAGRLGPLAVHPQMFQAAVPVPEKEQQKGLDNGPKLWDKLLEGVREIFEPEWCVVAGGAVRDYINKHPPKDIDVWIKLPNSKPKTTAELLEEAQMLGWKDVFIKGNPDAYGKEKNIQTVITGYVFGYQVELILVPEKTPQDVLDKFDFYANQCWYDGTVHSTRLASVDIKKNQWTPMQELTPATKEHFNRVNHRYGGKLKINTGEPWYDKFAGKEKIK